ncbi:MAG: hypothetical protein HUU15_10075 [Candidatus Brocadiae bacterium]|nr:hypothetical protein [Candidatus Brocadiia bacterium]
MILDLFKRPKRMSDLKLEDVRREAARLDLREQQAIRRLEQMESAKEDLFRKGAKLKSPIRRKQLARQFEQKKNEIAIAERELNRLSKEAVTLAAIRMAVQRKQDMKKGVLSILSLAEEGEVQRLLEDDKISYDMYMERLGEITEATKDSSQDIVNEVGKEGAELMDIWQKMDDGEIDSFDTGLRLAEEKLKEKPLPEEETE